MALAAEMLVGAVTTMVIDVSILAAPIAGLSPVGLFAAFLGYLLAPDR